MARRARTTFSVKEFPNKQPWIHIETVTKLDVLENGFLAFDLRHGTTRQEARRVARYLNSKIRAISYTPLPGRRSRKI
jgi:hypothetical protein